MKVVVIADDLTGAAELATAAANLGHSCEVQTRFDATANVDVIAVDTDTRSLPPGAAAQVVSVTTREILRANPDWIYKKTDSVLRGNVRAEIEAVMSEAHYATALLICANPSKGRVIRDGVYYIEGVPLAQTAFAADPWHPRRSSNVVELLLATGSMPIAQSTDENFAGITIPDIDDILAIRQLAASPGERSLAAGGVDFFSALIEARSTRNASKPVAEPLKIRKPVLFICGSQMAWQQGREAQCKCNNIPILLMPRGTSIDATAEWSQAIEQSLFESGYAMAAIGAMTENTSESQAGAMTDPFVDAIARLLSRRPPATVCAEGGATAAALFGRMQWTRLRALPAPQLAGVSVLQPSLPTAPVAMIKPGSYAWPEHLWQRLLSI